MLAHERYRLILEELEQHDIVKVGGLTKKCNVSTETIRRDLEHLEKEGLLKRVHGGAIPLPTNITQTNFVLREEQYQLEKQAIARHAIEFVTEGQCIALDVSTTNTEIARTLAKNFQQLTIITNSLTIAEELKNTAFTVILPGGVLRNSELCIVGDSAIQFINGFHIDLFFMSISGISLEEGLMDYGVGECDVKRTMYKNARQVYVVADHSKFNVTAMLRICPADATNGIITDAGVEEVTLKEYEDAGVLVFPAEQK
ncbi:DeoR/GlpR family DNA-binding transcription regulator [Alkalicoccobacillus porphyridii]|uniref:DeoR/GlpR transcriptional regulator n=1 Tax=Alkalicoccobacillus porphyridii TaxID=2597270 RepID=A0A554A157_9BACI|nr:DeoR/GlpR family DNA-binding transcription regulator [Alkalicoccobacillus porphyridii]TSB47419.1 DeoR/GlpR transcriptional regulator [Alkalicoccobacillus porphyridii]